MTESLSLSGASSTDAPHPAWAPRAWVAGVLNVLMPGWGQLYNGRPQRAVASMLVFALWVLLGIAAAVAAPIRALRIALVVVLVVGPWVAFAWDAAWVAGRTAPTRRRWYQCWYTLLAFAALWAFVLQPGIFALAKRHISEAYRIPTGSMVPTLFIGDYVLVSKWNAGAPQRGEVVVFAGDSRDRSYVQRVVGLPGDTLKMRTHRLLRNGRAVDEPYVQEEVDADPTAEEFQWQRRFLVNPGDSATHRPTLGNWGPLVVATGHYFLLGDNRGSSYDGRYRGFVSAGQLIARPRWIYYSRAPQQGEHRWSRIGLAIR